MLEYVQWYYVPNDGYRSTPSIESNMEKQRQQTVATFVDALKDYTGADLGMDSENWLTHLRDVEQSGDLIPADRAEN